MIEFPEYVINKIKTEIKMLLHASRDCMRNRKEYDTTKIRFSVNDSYYGEAFGMLRTIQILGCGKFGAVNDPKTLNFWFAEIEDEVLQEENFNGSHECEHCYNKYGKDDVRKM